jgi:hypothetical protein
MVHPYPTLSTCPKFLGRLYRQSLWIALIIWGQTPIRYYTPASRPLDHMVYFLYIATCLVRAAQKTGSKRVVELLQT